MKAVLRNSLRKLFEFILKDWFKNDIMSAFAFLAVVLYFVILLYYGIQISEYFFHNKISGFRLFARKLLLSSEAIGIFIIQFAISYYFQSWVMIVIPLINITFAVFCFYILPTKKKKLTEKR